MKLTAQPTDEWLFTGWSGDIGDIDPTENPIQLNIIESKTVTATFEKKKYPLTVSIEGEGEVLEEIVNAGRTTEYNSGTTVKLTAVPSEGWEFTGWEGAINGTSNPQQLLISEPKTVSATFINTLQAGILGKWNLNTSSSNTSSRVEGCEITSLIFNSDGTFKLYTDKYVIIGQYSISENTISLTFEDKELGIISNISIEGQSLSATFDLEDYCVTVEVSSKDSNYSEDRTYVPDDNFEKYLIELGYDDVLDDYVLTEKINSITSLGGSNPASYGRQIKSIRGIEDFISIKDLRMWGNELESLDISNNKELILVYLKYNNLKDINISSNIKLKTFDAVGNAFEVETIDISKNLALEEFSIGGRSYNGDYNRETSIGFSSGATNETVSITYPALESKISFINFSKNLNLKSLTISESSLQNFDVSDYLNLGNITYLSLRVNPISSVDLSKFTNLTQLNLYKTNL